MANEITVVCGLSMAKGQLIVGPNTRTKTQDWNGDDYADLSQTVATSIAALDLGVVDTSKLYTFFIENTDTTNYVELSDATAGDFDAGVFARLLPNGGFSLNTRTGVIYARANTAACKITVRAVENAA